MDLITSIISDFYYKFIVMSDSFTLQYLLVIFTLIALRLFVYDKWKWAKRLFWIILILSIIFIAMLIFLWYTGLTWSKGQY